ncbi:MAG TPA: hypothetical protein VGG72_10395 [Bryobacteraceae bacterium]
MAVRNLIPNIDHYNQQRDGGDTGNDCDCTPGVELCRPHGKHIREGNLAFPGRVSQPA